MNRPPPDASKWIKRPTTIVPEYDMRPFIREFLFCAWIVFSVFMLGVAYGTR